MTLRGEFTSTKMISLKDLQRDMVFICWYITNNMKNEQYENAESAIQREKRLKFWHRKWKIRLIEETNPEWQDRYDAIIRSGFQPSLE